jgi:hypothetical protein
MGIEWFRDLTIIVMGCVTVVVLIFASILFYRLYRKAKSVLQLAESTMQSANEIVTLVKDFVKPALPIMTIIQGLCGGLGGITGMFKKENNEGGKNNE